MFPTGWENSDPLDGPGGHRLQEVLVLQRRVELRGGHVGGDLVRRAAVLESHQQRRELCVDHVCLCVFSSFSVFSLEH